MEHLADVVVVTADDLYGRLKLYFEHIDLPKPTHLERILNKLRARRLIRFQKDDERFGESRLEILPTLPRAIPFERPEEWAQNVAMFQEPTSDMASDDQGDSFEEEQEQ